MPKLTPLLITSIAIVVYAFYYTFSGQGGSLVGIGVAVILAGAISVFLMYLGFREAFKSHFRRQVIVELIIVVFGFLVYFLVWLAKPTEM